MRVLVVEGSAESGEVAGIAAELLGGNGHDVVPLNLVEQGFDTFMSETERRAYHEADNLVTEAQRTSAELLASVDALLVATALREGTIHPITKSWFERVFIPEVSFTFTDSGRVTGALGNIGRVGMIVECPDDDYTKHRRNSSTRSVLRAVRMNAARTCRTTYLAVAPETDRRSAIGSSFGRW